MTVIIDGREGQTLLDDLKDKPYTFQAEDHYALLEQRFNQIVETGAMSLYGDLKKALDGVVEREMRSWLPEAWQDVPLDELGALLMVEWMRE